MLTYIGFAHWRADTREEARVFMLESGEYQRMAAEIPDVLSLDVFASADTSSGYDAVAILEFADMEAWERFSGHPAHKRLQALAEPLFEMSDIPYVLVTTDLGLWHGSTDG